MGDHETLRKLMQSQCRNFPQITQLLRVSYRSLGADLTPRYPRFYNEYSETKFAVQLGLDSTLRAVCIVLIDGMGWELLQAAKAHLPFLRGHLAETIEGRTVLPSTTATALTSFTTGEPPAYTNMLGYSVRTPTGTANLINFKGMPLAPEEWQPVPPLFTAANEKGIDTTVISAERFRESGLTQAAFRGSSFQAAESLEQRVAYAKKQLQSGRGLTYLYWSELDHVGHSKGWGSLEWVNELEHVDSCLRELAQNCPKDAAIIITADHGMIDVNPKERLDLAAEVKLAAGVEVIAGEGRCVQLHAEKGQAEAVIERWKNRLGETALIITDPKIVYNGEISQRYQADALVFSLGNQVIVDSRAQSSEAVNLIGVHGSVSYAETAIPFLRL